MLVQEKIDLDSFDLEQIIAVARMFAARGDVGIKKVMYTSVKRAGFEQAGSCYADLIALDGMDALKAAVEEIPEAPDDFNIWTVGELLHALELRDGAEAAHVAMKEASQSSPKLRMLVDESAKAASRKPRVDELMTVNYASLKSTIQAGSKFRQLSKWGLSASVEELQSAAEDLIEETDKNRLLTYLSIFRKVRFPGPIDKLVELAESPDVRLARAAVRVLSQISDPRIRTLLLKLLGSCSGDAIELMANNFVEGDFNRIEASLHEARDEDSLHDMGMGLRHLLAVRLSPDAVNSMIFLYEKGPCSLCRGELVEKLNALNSIPDWMREECLYDADPETRKLVMA